MIITVALFIISGVILGVVSLLLMALIVGFFITKLDELFNKESWL